MTFQLTIFCAHLWDFLKVFIQYLSAVLFLVYITAIIFVLFCFYSMNNPNASFMYVYVSVCTYKLQNFCLKGKMVKDSTIFPNC